MFSLILMIFKLGNSFTRPLGKSAMSRQSFCTIFDKLGQLAAEILVIL